MQGICGKRTYTISPAMLTERLIGYSDILIDIGTGDGRYVLHSARTCAGWFAIGVDTCRENLRAASGRAPRNALFVIAEARALPAELRGLTSRIAINFPWGSLLQGLLDGDAEQLGGLAASARPGATLEIRLNSGALAETGWSLDAGAERIRQVLDAGGFAVRRPVALDARALRACPTTWAKRLAFGRDPRALYLQATVRSERMKSKISD